MNYNLVLAGVVLCIVSAGCQHTAVDETAETFNEALATCRFFHTGSGGKRLQLRPTEEHVADCLERRGWLPSGIPAPAPANESVGSEP